VSQQLWLAPDVYCFTKVTRLLSHPPLSYTAAYRDTDIVYRVPHRAVCIAVYCPALLDTRPFV